MASTPPPEWPTGQYRPPPRTLWSDLSGLWARFRNLPVALQLVIGSIATVLIVWVVSSPFRSDSTDVATRSSTTVRTVPSTTTTTIRLPDGDDRTVKSVLDGDSFELTDATATKVRLIGIDAPDVETSDCFSAEATAHLRMLLPAGASVRLVYDATKTDRFGRTLAYVYRLSDGLFLNLALARDGMAIELTTAPNTIHADEIRAAVADAQAARRGVWQTCRSTTTAGRTATTSGSTATTSGSTATTGAGATTTSEPSSTTSTAPTVSITTPPTTVDDGGEGG